MTQCILYTTAYGKSALDQWTVAKESLTTQIRSGDAGHEATVKQSLTVQVEAVRVATTEEYSAVHSSKEDKK